MHDNLHTARRRGRVGRSLTVLLAVLMAAVSGCTSPAKFTPTSDSENFPPYEGEVRILENLPPSDQYKRVGVVVVAPRGRAGGVQQSVRDAGECGHDDRHTRLGSCGPDNLAD